MGRKFKEIMSKLGGNFIFQSGSTARNSSDIGRNTLISARRNGMLLPVDRTEALTC